ncbi:MAG: arsenate reductase (glutaredoxin) [Methanobacteriota archaeon]|nr:MAG: arsenate reductase (glutaredoxin) [Euryarchaeota archaeon]HIG20842.1 arsenate reductase (glutaredoxin) [Candidatus Poseidoniales archaeon]
MVKFQSVLLLGDTVKLYHNPRCSKSRQTLDLVHKESPEVVLYLKNPLPRKQIEDLLTRLKDPISELIRWGDKEAPNKPEHIDSQIIIDILVENPKLMQRPILDDGKVAIICRPPEKALGLI